MGTKMKVLIAYDGRHPIQYLTQDLKRAGLPEQANAVVITVVDAFMPPSTNYSELSLPESSVHYMETVRKEAEARINKELMRARKTAEKAAKYLQSSFRNWTIRSEACVDSPAWAVVKKGDEWKPDLIVMGSHGGSPMARFFLGSVSRGVLIHSNRSIHIIRHHRRSAKHSIKIIIGMDGSADSQKTLQVVAGRTWPKGTLVRLVTAFDEKMESAVASHYLAMHAKKSVFHPPTERAWVRQMMEPYVEKLEKTGLKVSESIKAGTPWKILVKEAEAWNADCVFVGARGLGAWKRFLLGSVSNAVASRAHCSVEVVR